jgi:peptidoglycan/LPS O-acetylase OafA/YrhL
LGDFFKLQIAYSFYPVPFFLLGMLCYAFRDRIRLSWLPAVLLAMAYVLTRFSVVSTILLYAGFAYGLLWLASASFLRRLSPKYDYSYGIYLYGFVVQQTVASFVPALNSYVAFALSVPITVALAALSWHWVERPCLTRFRSRNVVKSSTVVASGHAS